MLFVDSSSRVHDICPHMNHFRILTFFGLLLSLSLPHSVYATTWGMKETVVSVYSFSEKAFGKEVASVSVHTGILKERSTCAGEHGTFWDSVQDIKMERSGSGRFFAKAMFASSSGECQPLVRELVVQYFVLFTDGSQMVTEVLSIPTQLNETSSSQDFQDQIKSLGEDFRNWADSDSTRAWGVKYNWAD